jgi:hypothetical protein
MLVRSWRRRRRNFRQIEGLGKKGHTEYVWEETAGRGGDHQRRRENARRCWEMLCISGSFGVSVRAKAIGGTSSFLLLIAVAFGILEQG